MKRFASLREIGVVVFIVTVFLALSCGVPPSQRPKQNQSISSPPASPTPTAPAPTSGPQVDPVTLYLFGAPPCEPCRHEIPEIQARIKSEFAGRTDLVQTTVWVVSGTSFLDKPTLEATEAWTKVLGIDPNIIKVVNDEWKYKKYKVYFNKPDAVPTAVILNKSGEVLKKFWYGAGNISPDLIMAKLHELIP